MKKIMYLLFICILYGLLSYAEKSPQNILAKKIRNSSTKEKRQAKISFIFKNEELIDIINMLAEHKGVNVVLPTGAQAITTKITMAIPEKVTLNEAWDLLYTILDITGYSLEQRKNEDGSTFYIIIKNSIHISKDPFPLYIDTPIDDLPNTDERIRYMYYLKNIKVSLELENQLNQLFKGLMLEDNIMRADKASNGILLIGKSQDIRSFMQITQALDETDFKESFDIIHLNYTQAPMVAQIFNESILKTQQPPQRYHLDARKQQEGSYFAGNIKIIAEPRSNSLVVLGRTNAIERVKEFIFQHIDREMESGKSILHVYELQYLDAATFAPDLRKIVESASTGGTEQSKAAGAQQSGPDRFFDQVIIKADTPPEASDDADIGKYSGGNKLIIAARNDDWKRIKKIIAELDKPQPQVILEVLIADLTLEDARTLGVIARNPAQIPFPGTSSAQSAMINQVVLDQQAPISGSSSLKGVNSDLNAETVPSGDSFTSVPQTLLAGTSVLSISDKDGKTWSLLQVLKLFRSTKILTHPHIIATNNKPAKISVGQSRLVVDQAAPSTSGITRRKTTLEANTDVGITPRISSANTVNLQVEIAINQFVDPTDFADGNRVNRNIVTNASIKSGDILALGGLIIETTQDSVVRTPLLSDIPLLGWFFKNRNKDLLQTSIVVFISPTIIQPKLRGGVGEYTEKYVDIAESYARQTNFMDAQRDPIVRWFFRGQGQATDIAYSFLEPEEFKSTHESSDEEAPPTEKYVVDTAEPLKDFLASQDNPLNKNQKKTIKGAVRIKESERPAHTKRKIDTNNSCSSCKKNIILQNRDLSDKPYKQQIQKKEQHTHIKEDMSQRESKDIQTITSKHETLKSILAQEENPLAPL